MGFVIGFGSTEQEFVRSEERAIGDHIKARYAELGLHYFSDEFTKEIDAWVKARGKALKAKAAEYKTASDYPERYSDYYGSVLSDASHIVVVLNLMHINRRHAFSPDGWAGLTERAVFLFDTFEMPVAEKAAREKVA